MRPKYRPVEVFSAILDDTNYVLVTDMVNSSIVAAWRFFLCSGEPVPYGTAADWERYTALQQAYYSSPEKFTLLWTNIKI